MTNDNMNETKEFLPVHSPQSNKEVAEDNFYYWNNPDPEIKRIMNDWTPFERIKAAYHAPTIQHCLGRPPYQFSDRAFPEFISGEPVYFVQERLVGNQDSSRKEMNNRGLVYFDSKGNPSFTNPERSPFFMTKIPNKIGRGIMFFAFFVLALYLITLPITTGLHGVM